jgi:hypothetical protein
MREAVIFVVALLSGHHCVFAFSGNSSDSSTQYSQFRTLHNRNRNLRVLPFVVFKLASFAHFANERNMWAREREGVPKQADQRVGGNAQAMKGKNGIANQPWPFTSHQSPVTIHSLSNRN